MFVGDFELTNLVLSWLSQKYPNRFRYLRGHPDYYEILIGMHSDPYNFTHYPASNALFIGKDCIWLYTSFDDFILVPSADPTFFEQINAHIEKYWVPVFDLTS